MEILLRRDFGPVLRPCDEVGERALKGITQGKLVTVNVKQPRNPQHHRLFFALVSKVFENLPESMKDRFPSVELLVAAIKIVTGHCDLVEVKGEIHKVPKSISFAAMDQNQFSEFFDRAADFIVAYVIPGLKKEMLLAEIQEMVGPR